MKFPRKSFLATFLIAGLLSVGGSVVAAVTINNFDLNPKTITASNSTLNYTFKISTTIDEIRTKCNRGANAGSIYAVIVGSSIFGSPNPEYVVIRGEDFLNNGSVSKTGSFKQQIISGQTSDGLNLEVFCSANPLDESGYLVFGTSLAESGTVNINISGQGAGVLSATFDATPKTVSQNPMPFRFPLVFKAKANDLKSTCSNTSFHWVIYKLLPNAPNNFSNSNKVQEGDVPFTRFNDNTETSYTPVFQQPVNVSVPNGDFVFKVRATCQGTLLEKQLTVSSAVPISNSVVGQKYSCNSSNSCVADPNGTYTTSNCNNQCGGGGGGGEEKTFSFNIPNPLKGGANDLGGLVRIIAQWLFNLAIPIAVIMIIYAGVLFLTAQGNPTTITKAKDVLKWAVVGLAIILIGSGVVTLIQSTLELGAPSSSSGQPPGGTDGTVITVGAVGNKCSRDRDCVSGLKCKNSICQRATGNLVGEPCNGGTNCASGLACDKTGAARVVIDGQTLGACFQP